ncbi:hypothetical protein KSS87_004803, partial [Heliosperma pusillum]
IILVRLVHLALVSFVHLVHLALVQCDCTSGTSLVRLVHLALV